MISGPSDSINLVDVNRSGRRVVDTTRFPIDYRLIFLELLVSGLALDAFAGAQSDPTSAPERSRSSDRNPSISWMVSLRICPVNDILYIFQNPSKLSECRGERES